MIKDFVETSSNPFDQGKSTVLYAKRKREEFYVSYQPLNYSSSIPAVLFVSTVSAFVALAPLTLICPLISPSGCSLV
jgi:hypothetical protein